MKYEIDHSEKLVRAVARNLSVSYIRTLKSLAKKPQKKGSWTCACGNVATGKFCSNCGAKAPEAEWFCSDCGAKNPADAKFCSNCGKKK